MRTDLFQNSEKSLEPVNVVKTVAERAGVSTDTVAKVRVIEQHIQAAGDNEMRQRLLEGKDTSINKEYKRIIQAERMAEALAKVEQAVLEPSGLYHVQMADPPWLYEKRNAEVEHRAKLPYPPMTQDEIIEYALTQILPFFYPDAIFWLWTTNAFIWDAKAVCDAIGFEVKTKLTWFKNKMGTGDWLRGQTEDCLMAVRGHPVVTLTNQTTALYGVVREHSRKPDEFYELVLSLCPGRRAEHFARERREGFDCIGAELDAFDQPATEAAAAL
jgi:N6-adenosine-specific RNA methylase IME4